MSANDENKTTAGDIGDKARSATNDVMDAARRTGREAADSLSAEAQRRGDSAKHATAGEIRTVADALRKAADDLQDGSYQERTFGYLASNLADISDRVENKDLSEVFEDITYYARRNPLLFLGGAALLGFAATRFGKATARSSSSHPSYGSSSYGTSSGGGTGSYGTSSTGGTPSSGTSTPGGASPYGTTPTGGTSSSGTSSTSGAASSSNDPSAGRGYASASPAGSPAASTTRDVAPNPNKTGA